MSDLEPKWVYSGEYKVEKEAIIRGRGRALKYPFPTMEVGDRFYAYRDKNDNLPSSKIYNARNYWEKKLPGRKFDVHVVSVGMRVQRVE